MGRQANVLITGEPGSGKTALARALLNEAPRAVVLDPTGEDYSLDGLLPGASGKISSSLEEAVYFISERREEDYRLIYRPTWNDAVESNLLIDFVEKMQLRFKLPPIAIGLEEATTYSETHSLLPAIERAYTKGRHARLNILTLTQIDTEIHRIVRFCSPTWVSMKAAKLSGDMSARFDREAVSALEVLTWDDIPEQGRHYLTYPRDADIFALFAEALAL